MPTQQNTSRNDVRTRRTDRCPNCNARLQNSTAEEYCPECGTITQATKIDTGPEWRSLDDESDRARTGPARTETLHDNGLSTTFYTDRDSKNNLLSSNRRRLFNRIKTYHSRSRFESKKERNLAYALSEIQRISTTMGLNTTGSVVTQACRLFRTAHDKELCQGRSIDALAPACIYATCRINALGRSPEEISTTARCSQSQLWNGYKVLNRKLNLPTVPRTAQNVAPSVLDKVSFDTEQESLVYRIVEDVDDQIHRKPKTVIAGAIYIVSHLTDGELTQGEIATKLELADKSVSAGTIEILEILSAVDDFVCFDRTHQAKDWIELHKSQLKQHYRQN